MQNLTFLQTQNRIQIYSKTPSKLQVWWLATRPKTLPVSLSPILVGTALAWHLQGFLFYLPLLVAIISAALIQIGTNLFNDVADFEKGVDTPNRSGPKRATAQGWLQPKEVKRAAWLTFLLAFIGGIYLVIHGGWVIVAIGLLSLLAGWSYTCGPFPIAYRPLGELFVLIFFGFAAVCGSFYLQTFFINKDILFLSLIVGIHAAAVISVNNYRDLEEDKKHGKNTLAVKLGKLFSQKFYAVEILLPYILLILYADKSLYLALFTLPLAVYLIIRFCKDNGEKLNNLLAMTAKLQLLVAILLSVGIVLYK